LRISFSIDLKPESGKQNFAIRLANELHKHGVKITNKKPDINLVFLKGTKKKCKNIFRLDGVWMNSRVSCAKKNHILSKRMNQCDGVIYQNEFCKQASDAFLGKFQGPQRNIPNGADPGTFNNPYQHPRPYVLALCKWRPHKRLKEIIKGFRQSGIGKTHDLFICGSPDYKKKHSHVVYCGKKPIRKIEQLIAGCDFTVHLAYCDWCPNSVVESLVAGKPVLHTDSGGTKYLVQDDGVCLKDRDWSFKIIDLYKPPHLNAFDLAESFNKMLSAKEVYRPDLFISSIAKRYLDFFEAILSESA